VWGRAFLLLPEYTLDIFLDVGMVCKTWNRVSDNLLSTYFLGRMSETPRLFNKLKSVFSEKVTSFIFPTYLDVGIYPLLEFKTFTNLRELIVPSAVGPLPPTLETIWITKDFTSENFTNLEFPNCTELFVTESHPVRFLDLSGFVSLKKFALKADRNHTEFPFPPSRLEYFGVISSAGCPYEQKFYTVPRLCLHSYIIPTEIFLPEITRNLEYLKLRGCPTFEHDVDRVTEYPKLTQLDLSHSKWEMKRWVDKVIETPSLRALNLSNISWLSHVSVAKLVNLPDLELLVISPNALPFPDLTNLTALKLDTDAKKILQHVTHLKNLRILLTKALCSGDLAQKFPKLEVLGCKVQNYRNFYPLTNLTSLQLHNSHPVPARFLLGFTKLRVLELPATSVLTDEDFAGLTNLTALRVSLITGRHSLSFSLEITPHVFTFLPKLRFICIEKLEFVSGNSVPFFLPLGASQVQLLDVEQWRHRIFQYLPYPEFLAPNF
jgi:hypothetical protein